MNLLMKMR